MSLIEVLGSQTRIKILQELTRESMYVSELAEAVGIDGKSAVHHLSVLEDAGLVEFYWRGNRKYYRLVSKVELRAAPPPERTFILHATDVDSEAEN